MTKAALRGLTKNELVDVCWVLLGQREKLQLAVERASSGWLTPEKARAILDAGFDS